MRARNGIDKAGEPVSVQAWKCPHCNVSSQYKSSIERHMKNYCNGNRHCSTCKWFFVDYPEDHEDHPPYRRCTHPENTDTEPLWLLVTACPLWGETMPELSDKLER
jgi:hypothetical protein